MYADSLYAGWRRNWITIASATLLLLALAAAWIAFSGQSYFGRAQVLVSLKVPDSGQDATYQVEISRTLAINYVMDDLEQLVTGAAFAGLVADRLAGDSQLAVDPGALAMALSADRTHRGLNLYVYWNDRAVAERAARTAAEVMTQDLDELLPAFAEIANASVIDWGSGVDRQTLLRNALTVLLGGAIGFFGALLAVAVGIGWRGRVHLDEPDLPGGLKVLAAPRAGPMNNEFEIASLRARVLAQLGGSEGVVLLVAPGPVADAAAAARQLAQALADAGHGALLVEAASAPTGLAGHCRGQVESLAHALESDPPRPGPGEMVVLGGALTPARIANPGLSAWLRRAGGLVVLLTADFSQAADAIALCSVADAALLVVADGRSRRDRLQTAIEDLRAAGLEPLGLVAGAARV